MRALGAPGKRPFAQCDIRGQVAFSGIMAFYPRSRLTMAKAKTVYSCTECGGQTLKWQGQCPHCGAWNTLAEAVAERASTRYQGLAQASQVQALSAVEAAEEPRRCTGIGELDRVLGGGLVRGG